MSTYREIRVRPVVRYVITEFEADYDAPGAPQHSYSLGEFDNVVSANQLAELLANERNAHSDRRTIFEPARQLKIEWLRGPGEPMDAIRWELREVGRE
jgi:hypothetical protein